MIGYGLFTFKQMSELNGWCSRHTEAEIIKMLESECSEKICPAIKGKCALHGCAFFTIDRPYLDKRKCVAICSYAGKRDIALAYGYPSDASDIYGLEGV